MVVRVVPLLSPSVPIERRTPLVRAQALLLTATVLLVTMAAVEAARAWSRAAAVQTQWPTLVLALLLVGAAPGAFGVRWAGTGRHWRAVTTSLLIAGAVVGAFRLVGGTVPWTGWQIWIAVPVAEELLFRGFCLTAVLWSMRRGYADDVAARVAVVISAVVFGLEHLGNADVGPVLVTLQVVHAVGLGLVTGWLRVRTGSLVAPVLTHATVNAVAVL